MRGGKVILLFHFPGAFTVGLGLFPNLPKLLLLLARLLVELLLGLLDVVLELVEPLLVLIEGSDPLVCVIAFLLVGYSSWTCYFLTGLRPICSPGTTLPQKGLNIEGGTYRSRLPSFRWACCRA